MKSELEQLRAENAQIKEQMQKLGNLLIDYFAYRQRIALNFVKSAAELMIHDEGNKQSVHRGELLDIYNKNFDRLEEAREVGLLVGSFAEGSHIPKSVLLTNVSEEVQAFQNIGKFFHEVGQVDLQMNIPEQYRFHALQVPIYVLCFCIRQHLKILLDVTMKSKVIVQFSVEKSNLAIQIKNHLNSNLDLDLIKSNFFDNTDGVLDHAGSVITSLYGGESNSWIEDDQLSVMLTFPLIETGGAYED